MSATSEAERPTRDATNPRTDAGAPPGSNAAVGENSRHTPVNPRLNSRNVTRTSPREGSLRYTWSPLKPRTTTKWLSSQCAMQGSDARSRMSSGS